MGIKNHNTKREKNVMIKRLRIAVFIAVSLGIVLIVFRYFGFVSKTIYEESVSHLTEVFHQSDHQSGRQTDQYNSDNNIHPSRNSRCIVTE